MKMADVERYPLFFCLQFDQFDPDHTNQSETKINYNLGRQRIIRSLLSSCGARHLQKLKCETKKIER